MSCQDPAADTTRRALDAAREPGAAKRNDQNRKKAHDQELTVVPGHGGRHQKLLMAQKGRAALGLAREELCAHGLEALLAVRRDAIPRLGRSCSSSQLSLVGKLPRNLCPNAGPLRWQREPWLTSGRHAASSLHGITIEHQEHRCTIDKPACQHASMPGAGMVGQGLCGRRWAERRSGQAEDARK